MMITPEPNDLLTLSIGLSVYISAIRLYGEQRYASISKDNPSRPVLRVMIFIVSIPDLFFVIATGFLLVYYGWGFPDMIRYAAYAAAIGIVLLIALHMVEWARNIRRIGKIKNRSAAFSAYLCGPPD